VIFHLKGKKNHMMILKVISLVIAMGSQLTQGKRPDSVVNT